MDGVCFISFCLYLLFTVFLLDTLHMSRSMFCTSQLAKQPVWGYDSTRGTVKDIIIRFRCSTSPQHIRVYFPFLWRIGWHNPASYSGSMAFWLD
jgi:hypothetical protein